MIKEDIDHANLANIEKLLVNSERIITVLKQLLAEMKPAAPAQTPVAKPEAK